MSTTNNSQIDATTARLLQARKTAKKKKPVFGRKDSNKKKRIESDVWRRARGCDNKQRLKRKGHKKSPKQGFRSPIEVRGLDATGLITSMVHNPAQLKGLTKAHGVVVASHTGDRKRKLILEEANKMGLTVLNLDAAKAIEQINTRLNERLNLKKQMTEEQKAKEAREKKEAEKAEKKAEAKQAHAHDNTHAHDSTHTHDKKESDTEASDDHKKKLEKEEKDKVLTSGKQ